MLMAAAALTVGAGGVVLVKRAQPHGAVTAVVSSPSVGLACASGFVYRVELEGTSEAAGESRLLPRSISQRPPWGYTAELAYDAIATEAGRTLWQVTARKPAVHGLPAELAESVRASLDGQRLWLETRGGFQVERAFSQADTPAARVRLNQLKQTALHLSHALAAGASSDVFDTTEPDALGQVVTRYRRTGSDAYERQRSYYVAMHGGGPRTTVEKSREELQLQPGTAIPQSLRAQETTRLGLSRDEGVRSSTTTTFTLMENTPRAMSEEQACRTTLVTDRLQSLHVRQLELGPVVDDQERLARRSDLLERSPQALIEKAREEDPKARMRTVDDLITLLTLAPEKTGEVITAIHEAKGDAEWRERLISALAAVDRDEPKRALDNLIAEYRQSGDTDMLARTVRAVQLAPTEPLPGTLDRLWAGYRDGGLPAQARQASVLALGSAAARSSDLTIQREYGEKLRTALKSTPAGSGLSRLELIASLGNLGYDGALDDLRAIYRGTDHRAAVQAIGSLRFVKAPEVEQDLLGLVHAHDLDLRAAALHALMLRTLTPSGCEQLMSLHRQLAPASGSSAEADRIQILRVLGQNIAHPAVREFIAQLDVKLFTDKERALVENLRNRILGSW
jgi:hypothetical protein